MGCFLSGDSRFDSGPAPRGAHEDAVAPLLVVPDEARVGALHGRYELPDLGAQQGGNESTDVRACVAFRVFVAFGGAFS